MENDTRVTLHDPLINDLHKRVGRLENNVSKARDREHSHSTELALVRKDLSYVKESQDNLSKGISRIFWVIGISVLGAFTTFILSGGLSVQP